MKKFQSFLYLLLLCLPVLPAMAQKKKSVSIDSLIQHKSFLFVATQMNPLRGRTIFLTSSYDVKFNGDTLNSYLPYFGRSDRAPLSSDDAGIIFTSVNYGYDVTPGKKGGWDILVTLKDQSDFQKFNITVYNDGSAMLGTISNFRDPITFRGSIVPVPVKKKQL